MKKIIASIYGAVIALLITIIYDKIFNQLLSWPIIASLLVSISIGALLLIFYEFILTNKMISRFFLPVHKVEGAWKINVTNSNDRPESLCLIQSIQAKTMFLKGME